MINSKITFNSAISGKDFPEKDRVVLKTLRQPILNLIKEDYPNMDFNQSITVHELNVYREKYISKYLESEIHQLSDLEKNVINSMSEDKSFVSKMSDETETRTFGQRIADKVADFGGSWTFIIFFLSFIVVWILSNVIFLFNKGFDPYPFILLNLRNNVA